MSFFNDRLFAVSAIYTEFYDPGLALPPHSLIVNTISDADLCDLALTRAEEIVARSTAPVINRPANVRLTGRIENARRLAAIDGVIAPTTRALAASALLTRRPTWRKTPRVAAKSAGFSKICQRSWVRARWRH